MVYDKTSLRRQFLSARRSLSTSYKRKANFHIFSKLIKHPRIDAAQTLCCYVSYQDEVDTHPFIHWCLAHHKRVCIPKVIGDHLELHLITSLTTCTKGYKGILEPPSDSPQIQPKQVDVFVVLGLAFDKSGYRLGFGKGYTDKLLAGLNTFSLGIAYQNQIVATLPHDVYDIPVSEVVTEGDIMPLSHTDPEIYKAIEAEKQRQLEGLEMIPSENYVSEAVLEAMGSILTNKYSEGFPRRRYYGGNKNIDVVEEAARNRAKEIFGVEHVNVQPYSGSPANFAVLNALLEPGDSFSGMNLLDGGHLTHGWKVSAVSKFFNSHPYHVKKEGLVDFDELWQIAKVHKPKLIWCGATAYSRLIEFDKFAEIADSIGAFLVADIAHVAGLVVGRVHPNPVPYAHVVTTTTHKTLRGPRGGMIMITKKGLEKDPDMIEKIDRSVFPGLQGGPHNHTTAAIAVALKEASLPEFKQYAKQIIKNTKALADEFNQAGYRMVSGGSDNHLILLDLSHEGSLGAQLEYALDVAHITTNKNTIPCEPCSPYYPSGLRLGTPALTTRGFKEKDMHQVGKWIVRVIDHIKDQKMPSNKEERSPFMREFRQKAKTDAFLIEIAKEIKEYTAKFPIPGIKV